MAFKRADKVYVDESKARGFYFVATSSDTGNLKYSEKALRSVLKPGQRRVHFKKESDSRRREILSLVIERDESLVQSDKRVIAGILMSENSKLNYQHVGPHEHPLLWVSDAVAWCFFSGGDWLRRSSPIVDEVIYLT